MAGRDTVVENDGAGCRHWTPPCGEPAHLFSDAEKWCSAGRCQRYSRNGTAKPDTTRLINPGLPPFTVVVELSVNGQPPETLEALSALKVAYPASAGPVIRSSMAPTCSRAVANRS
jgi:hypothetical protein